MKTTVPKSLEVLFLYIYILFCMKATVPKSGLKRRVVFGVI